MLKNPPANAGDMGDTGSIPEWGRFPGGGHGSSLQHSCLGNCMDRGTWQVIVRGGHKRVGHNLATKEQLQTLV